MQGQTHTNRRASHTFTTHAAFHCNGKGAFTASLKQSTSEHAMSHTHPRSAAPTRVPLRALQSLSAHRTECLSAQTLGSAAPLNADVRIPRQRAAVRAAHPRISHAPHTKPGPRIPPRAAPPLVLTGNLGQSPQKRPSRRRRPSSGAPVGARLRGSRRRLPVPDAGAAALRRVQRDWAGGPGKFLYMMEGAGPGRGGRRAPARRWSRRRGAGTSRAGKHLRQ